METINDTHQPLVSIVVITYHSADYILETLESAKEQSYGNLELIISDDGSKDDTVEICRNWLQTNVQRFARTELLTVTTNTGIPANCNRGTKAARGEWIKLIAGDDILMPNCIQDYLLFSQTHSDAKFITADLRYIDKDSRDIPGTPISYQGLRNYYLAQDAAGQLKTYARIPLFLNTPAFFYQKLALFEAGYFDEEFKIFEDTCLIYRFNAKGWKVFYMPVATVKYRVMPTSISRDTSRAKEDFKYAELKNIFNKYRRKHLSKLNIIDLSVYYEMWLDYDCKGLYGCLLASRLKKLSANYWFLKYLDARELW